MGWKFKKTAVELHAFEWFEIDQALERAITEAQDAGDELQGQECIRLRDKLREKATERVRPVRPPANGSPPATDEPKKPEGYEDDLGPYGPVSFDAHCGEPVSWGFKITRRLGEPRFNWLRNNYAMDCHGPGEWVVVTSRLRPEKAVEKYGPVTDVEWGPRGGFRSVTFGDKKFVTKDLRPDLR